MQKFSKLMLIVAPAAMMTAACDAPTNAPEESMEDQLVSDDFSSEQPVVEDPMAGDTVVEESPGMVDAMEDAETVQTETDATDEGVDEDAENSMTTDETEKLE